MAITTNNSMSVKPLDMEWPPALAAWAKGLDSCFAKLLVFNVFFVFILFSVFLKNSTRILPNGRVFVFKF